MYLIKYICTFNIKTQHICLQPIIGGNVDLYNIVLNAVKRFISSLLLSSVDSFICSLCLRKLLDFAFFLFTGSLVLVIPSQYLPFENNYTGIAADCTLKVMAFSCSNE